MGDSSMICKTCAQTRLRFESALSVMNFQKQNWRVKLRWKRGPITRKVIACNTEWHGGSGTGIGASFFKEESDKPGVSTVQKSLDATNLKNKVGKGS
ncbi:hypothetical protein EJB05_41962, partial [Eragrostis curvula]